MASLIITEMYSCRDKNANTPLHIACATGNVSLAKFIVELNCDVTAVNSDGDTALHTATRTANLELVKAILNLVTDNKALHLCNKTGENSLHIACKIGDPLLFLELVRLESFHLAKNDYTLLHLACEHGHTHICLLYTSPSPRDATLSRMPSSA